MTVRRMSREEMERAFPEAFAQLRQNIADRDAQVRAATFRDAARLIQNDGACPHPAHRDYYAALLRDHADTIQPEERR